MLRKAFRWAREVAPSLPVFVSAWGIPADFYGLMSTYALKHSDVIGFHSYAAPAEFESQVQEMTGRDNRPVLVAEYVKRPQNTFQHALPVLKHSRRLTPASARRSRGAFSSASR